MKKIIIIIFTFNLHSQFLFTQNIPLNYSPNNNTVAKNKISKDVLIFANTTSINIVDLLNNKTYTFPADDSDTSYLQIIQEIKKKNEAEHKTQMNPSVFVNFTHVIISDPELKFYHEYDMKDTSYLQVIKNIKAREEKNTKK